MSIDAAAAIRGAWATAPPRRLPYLVLDVFTERRLEGNPLAVFPAAEGVDSRTMQAIARELSLSETVFVVAGEGEADAAVRIFTPTTELPFAGHPTLGTAHVVACALGAEAVTLRTGAGPVRVEFSDPRGLGWMRQPLPAHAPLPAVQSDELVRALRGPRPVLPVEVYDNGPRHAIAVLDSEDEVRGLDPDLRALGALGTMGVSCVAGAGARWRTRMFAPALGVAEDPATGSAAGPVAVHLARHGRIAFGEEIRLSQGEEIGRPSQLYAVAEGTAERLERVSVGGAVVVVARAELALTEP